MLASVTSSVVVPLIVGLLGGLVGGTFTRVTSRNDVRREKYAEALAALRELEHLPPGDPSRPNAEARVADLGAWLELDSLPVGEAYKELCATTDTGDKSKTQDAREKFITTARAFSRWTLLERPFLHVKASRTHRGD